MVGERVNPSKTERGRQGASVRSKHLTPEIYFLITKFLSNGPCHRALQAIREEIEEHNLMPKRIDWLGNEHSRSFDEVNRGAGHIKPDHLSTLCSIAQTLSEQGSSHPLRRSLLGLNTQSMFGSSSRPIMNESSLTLRNGVPPLPTVQRLATDPSSLIRALISRESMGHSNSQRTVPCDIYMKMKSHTRMLGHLSAVYCVGFDRTGRFIFTGADDRLLKIWSATDGRLLSTLRGHDGEITDFAVNYENTLLASASCDKTIRIWDLRTTAPITILVGHTQQVTSVKFCPLVDAHKRFLTSTANDGSVCFWSYDPSTNDFDSKPIKFNEKIKTTCHILTSSFSAGGMFLAIGTNDKYVRVYLVKGLRGPEKIMEIEAHSDNVDSLQFSNKSMRFISGSKDGTAFVWTYERQTWKNLPLKMTERLASDPILDEEEMVKVKVNMVGWTCDDQHVITSASDHSIKVWNPDTGKLIHSLRDHEDDVFCIESHPKDSRIFLSGGHDGKVIIWNVISGRPITIFDNTINGQGHGSIFDVRFSPDGQTIASTDSHGHLKIYGFGASEKFDKIPREVFFHTDYRPLVRDINHFVIDEQTQCPPHLMPPPFLVDIDGNPHEPKFQRLVPGRENCNERQLVPQIAIQNVQGVGEVLEAAIQDPILPPVQVIQERAPTIDDMIQRLAREQGAPVDHGYAAPPPPEVRHRNPSGNANGPGPRREGDVEGVRQIRVFRESGAPGPPLYHVRKVVTPLSYPEQTTLKGRLEQLAEFERHYYETQGLRKPVAATVSKEDPKQKKFTRRKRRIAQQYNGLNNGRPIRRNLARDPDIPEMSESSHVGSGAESWAESTSESESETEDSDEGGTWNGALSRRNRKGHRNAAVPNDADDNEEENESESEVELTVLELRKQQKDDKKKKRDEQLYEEMSKLPELPERFRYPEWLSEVLPRRIPFFPQIEDEVVYFKKGHQAYIEEVRKTDCYELGKHEHELFKKKVIPDQVFAKIIDIKYEVKPPRLVSLRLCVLRDNRETKHRFNVRYHDMPNVIDFIVLKQVYDNAQARYDDLSPGTRYKSIVDNEWWLGSVEAIHDGPTEFQNIMFKWDSGEVEPMSLWDLEPLSDNLEAKPGEGIPVVKSDYEAMAYRPTNVDEWPDSDRDTECTRISEGLKIIMQLRIAEHFNVPVDLSAHKVYGMVIPYFVDLSLIKARVENRFYRRKEALKFDISFIEKNCLQFNEAHTEIAAAAKTLTKVLIRFIDDVSCYDPSVIHQGIQAGDGTGPETLSEESQPGPSRASPSHRKDKKIKHDSRPSCWQRDCVDLISYLFTLKDSIPFRFPVDPIVYPDYNTIIETPMDLMTIKEQLTTDSYETLQEFKKDLDLVFENSRKYTPDKKSKIYAMTVRMANLCTSKFRDISTRKYRSSHVKKAKGPKPRVIKRKRSDDSDSQDARMDKPGPSRVQANKKLATRKPAGNLRNGQAKSVDFYKALVQSDDDSEEEINSHLNNGSDTEIEDKPDSEATEIDDDEEPVAKRKMPGEKRKAVIKSSVPKKKSRADSGSDTEFECDDHTTSRSESRTSNAASSSIGSRDTPTEMETNGRKGLSRRGKRVARTRTRNGGVSRVKYDEDDSDYDYGDQGSRTNTQGVSSRGRVIKFKGHARTSQVC